MKLQSLSSRCREGKRQKQRSKEDCEQQTPIRYRTSRPGKLCCFARIQLGAKSASRPATAAPVQAAGVSAASPASECKPAAGEREPHWHKHVPSACEPELCGRSSTGSECSAAHEFQQRGRPTKWGRSEPDAAATDGNWCAASLGGPDARSLPATEGSRFAE